MLHFKTNLHWKRQAKEPGGFARSSLCTRLLVTLIPLAVLILLVTGIITYSFSRIFLQTAQERTQSVTAYGMARELEMALENTRRSLLFAASGVLDEAGMRDFLARSNHSKQIPFREFALVSPFPDESIFLVTSRNEIFRIPLPEIPTSELLFQHSGSNMALRVGDVSLTGIEKAEYVLPLGNATRNMVFSQVVRMVTPATNHKGAYVMLSIDAAALRNILSRANSTRSPLWASAPVSDARFCFLFDLSGWILFQSNSSDEPEAPLMTSLARTGMEGTLGRPGHPEAFQPSGGAGAGIFWNMLSEVQRGKHGVLPDMGCLPAGVESTDHHSLAYWPVTFRHSRDGPTEIYGGLAFIDYSNLSLSAGYRQVDVIFVISLAATALLSLTIFFVSRSLTRPLRLLAGRVNAMRHQGTLEPLHLTLKDRETRGLGEAIDNLIGTVQRQMDEIRAKDEAILKAALQERATVEEMNGDKRFSDMEDVIPEIFGTGPRIEKLKTEILKAASVDVDVLIEGETGTGKQLTAEAIHRHSARARAPFISINCGELDENLLLDTLFGHVKGAFTEARTERKGAFVEAHAGTLFLDEIQSASAKVQQALLRALAMRVVRPLGCDRDVAVDVRIIAASNVALMELAESGRFRSDLYYRLRVLMIHTPALRDHRENIPRLARRFMDHAQNLAGRGRVDLSRGAMERLVQYDWPGNVRELQNCMIMTVTMAEGEVVQAADLHLDGAATGRAENALVRLSGRWPAPGWCPDAGGETGAGRSKGADAPGGCMDASKDGNGAADARPAADFPEEHPNNGIGEAAEDCGGTGTTSPDDAVSKSFGAAASRDADQDGTIADQEPGKPGPARDLAGGNGLPEGLNARQSKAWTGIMAEGSITRARYEELAGGDMSSRTAINDLQDFVDRGVLRKVGRGPATRYVVRTEAGDAQRPERR